MGFDEFMEQVLTTVLKGRLEGLVVFLSPEPLSLRAFLDKEPWARPLLEQPEDLKVWFAFIDNRPGEPWDHPCRYLLVADQDGAIVWNINAHFPPALLPEMQRVT